MCHLQNLNYKPVMEIMWPTYRFLESHLASTNTLALIYTKYFLRFVNQWKPHEFGTFSKNKNYHASSDTLLNIFPPSWYFYLCTYFVIISPLCFWGLWIETQITSCWYVYFFAWLEKDSNDTWPYYTLFFKKVLILWMQTIVYKNLCTIILFAIGIK